MLRVLITGGAGFIGSWVARRALERRPDTEVVLADRRLAPASRLPGGKARAVRMELVPGPQLAELVGAADVCVHCALGWGDDPAAMVEKDVALTAFLATEAARGRPRKLIYTSSVNAVGIRSRRMDEETLPRPDRMYAATKAASEALLGGWSRSAGLPCAVVRPAYTFGPPAAEGFPSQPAREFPELMAKVQAGAPVAVTRHEGAQFLPVEELADFYADLCETGTGFEIYQVAGDEYYTWARIAAMAIRRAGSHSSIEERPGDFPAEPNLFSAAKAARLRGRGFPAGDALERYISWLAATPDGVRPEP